MNQLEVGRKMQQIRGQYSYVSKLTAGVCLQTTNDYSPFGVSLDGRTIAYQPAPAPTPAVGVIYLHKFDDGATTHPYTTAPNQINTKLTNVSWTNSQSSWTNFTGYIGKAIAINSATPDTTRLYLSIMVNSGYMLDVKSYSFYHRSSTTGYTNYQLLVNGIIVGSGSIFVASSTTLQSTGTINVANAITGLTGSITITLKLFGGSNGNNATFRLDDFTLNGYTQLVSTPNLLAKGYRYGFDGMEKDDEVKGAGNSYDFGARMYDNRLGRFLSIDKYTTNYPEQSPYLFAGNCPIIAKDKNGDSIWISTAIRESTMAALKIANNSAIGKQLLDYYKTSKHENLFFYAFDNDPGEERSSWAETANSKSVSINSQGKVKLNYSNSHGNEVYINSSGFTGILKRKQSLKNHFIGRNFTNDIQVKLDKYDLAFILIHEMQAHIKGEAGSAAQDHKNFGSTYSTEGMRLWYTDDFTSEKKTIVTYGTPSWNAFKDILGQKIQDGNGTVENKADYEYMNKYENTQRNKTGN